MADITVGMNIRKFREARGLLQKDLGDRIGKNKNTVSNWERGLRDPGADNLKKIAAALEISPAELIGHNEQVRQDYLRRAAQRGLEVIENSIDNNSV